MNKRSERFLVRSRGAVLVDVELVPGSYMIGRSAECALHLAQPFVSRRHGSLWHEAGGWRYRDLRREGSEPVQINDDAPVALGPSLELVTGSYVVQHETLSRPRPRRGRPRLWASLVMIVALALGGGWLAHERVTAPLPPGELLARARGGVVSLELLPSEETRASLMDVTDLGEDDFLESVPFCSGFVVAPDVVLTANHCVQAADGRVTTDFVVTTDDGARHEVGRVLGYNVKRDYLLLEIPGLDVDAPFELREDFEVGERVYTLGNVEGQGLALRDGIAASVTPDRDRPGVDFLRFSAPASGGNSGGPLLDERGRVLGLVFARNRSETYNLATSSEFLAQGLERWVDSRDGDSIPVSAHDFEQVSALGTLERLGYPAVGRWYERPELSRPYEDLRYTQRVPVTLEELSVEVTRALDETVRPAYEASLAELSREGQLYRWDDLVDAEHPVARPLEAGASVLHRDGRVVADAVRSCSPEPAATIESARASASCHGRRLVDERLGEAEVYRPFTHGRVTLGRGLLGSIHGSVGYAEIRRPNAVPPSPETLIDRVVGEAGALLDLSGEEYLRPRARRAYALEALPTDGLSSETLEDARGRAWTVHRLAVFDQGHFVVRCKGFPGGQTCDGWFTPERDERALERWLENRARYSLAEQVLAPTFLHARAVAAWEPVDDFALPVDLRWDEESSRVVLETLGLEVRFSEPPRAVRVHRALTLVDGEATWFASGVDLVFERGDDRVACATTLYAAEDPDDRRAALPAYVGHGRLALGARVGAVSIGDAGATMDAYHGCGPLRRTARGYRSSYRVLEGGAPATAHLVPGSPLSSGRR